MSEAEADWLKEKRSVPPLADPRYSYCVSCQRCQLQCVLRAVMVRPIAGGMRAWPLRRSVAGLQAFTETAAACDLQRPRLGLRQSRYAGIDCVVL